MKMCECCGYEPAQFEVRFVTVRGGSVLIDTCVGCLPNPEDGDLCEVRRKYNLVQVVA